MVNYSCSGEGRGISHWVVHRAQMDSSKPTVTQRHLVLVAFSWLQTNKKYMNMRKRTESGRRYDRDGGEISEDNDWAWQYTLYTYWNYQRTSLIKITIKAITKWFPLPLGFQSQTQHLCRESPREDRQELFLLRGIIKKR